MEEIRYMSYEDYSKLMLRVIALADSFLIDDFSTSIVGNRYHISLISESYGGASVKGQFNREPEDVGGFFDMLQEMEEDYEDDIRGAED